MPFVIRAHKDVIDTRPIRLHQGPSSYSYRWKMIALLELNNKGEFILPFSRRVIHIDSLLWPRSHKQPPPHGYEVCGCIGCENKTYADHILNDDDPENGNLHVEEVYIESDNEKDDEQNETSTTDADISNDDENNQHDWSFRSVSDPPSPFPYDPYASYD